MAAGVGVGASVVSDAPQATKSSAVSITIAIESSGRRSIVSNHTESFVLKIIKLHPLFYCFTIHNSCVAGNCLWYTTFTGSFYPEPDEDGRIQKMSSVPRVSWSVFGLALLLGLAALACDLPRLQREEPTPVAPEPLGDTMSFSVPFYSVRLDPGATVPGTRLQYVRPREDGYDVVMDGFPAFKRAGDSFSWNGIVAPGVYGRFHLRLATTLLGRLVAAGPVDLYILYPNPVELPNLDIAGAPYHFDRIPVQFLVPQGGAIPGTTIAFQSQTDEGAWLTGAGHPFRAPGDSVVWIGRLRDNVTARYNLRVVRVERNGLRLLGEVELWVAPRVPPP
jgi:hypothetical protein